MKKSVCRSISVSGLYPARILLKSISHRYRPNRTPIEPITVQYRFKKNASRVASIPAEGPETDTLELYFLG